MRVGALQLCGGSVIEDVEVAFLCFGKLNEAGDNAILVTHGFTSGPSMLLRDEVIAGEGSWADLVGPGAAIDTDRYFVVCPNMLGSCYGTTGPGSINPATNRQWGPDFPEYSVQDMIASQYALLTRLGVRRLQAVVGPSYGGIQALQWAVDHPEMVERIGVAVSGPQFPSAITVDNLLARLKTDSQWNDGWIYANGGIASTMAKLRNETLRQFGMVEVFAGRGLTRQACDETIAAMAEAWAQEFDANSLIALCKAGKRFNAWNAIPRIKARMLWVISTSDVLFPPNEAVEQLVLQNEAHPAHVYVNMVSNYGHVASGADYRKWEPLLRDFLA